MATPVEVKIRLPRDMVGRLDKAATRCGMDRTEFVRNATLCEVAEVEEAARQKRLKPLRASTRVQASPADVDVMTAEDAPGLGFEIAPRSDMTAEVKPQQEDPVSRLARAIVEQLGVVKEEKPADPVVKVVNGEGFFSKLAKLLP